MRKLFFVLGAVAVFTSCKKEATVNPVPVPSVSKNLLKGTYVYDNGTPQTSNYTYDAQGRISVFKEDTRTTTFNYVSASLLVTTEKKNADNSLLGTKECEINANGYITKMVFKDPAGAVTFIYDFTYNTDGHLTKQKGTYANGSNYEEDYTFANGILVSSKLYYDGILNANREYTFDNTKINKTPFGQGGYWQSYILFGKRSKNLLGEFKQFDPAGTLTWHTQYTYDMGADGYPVKQTTNYLLQGKLGVETYIFQ